MINLVVLKTLINEGETVLKTKFTQDDGITVISKCPYTGEIDSRNHTEIINTYVSEDLFNKWYEKVKIFLKQNLLEDSIVQPSSLYKNFDIAKEQVAKLQGIYELNEDNGTTSIPLFKNFNIFIGHGHHLLWARIALHLIEEYQIKSIYYESECRTGISIDSTINDFINNDNIKFAILTLMKEDETTDGSKRARQNVIHELGLFRDKLGPKRVAMIVEKGLELPSNVNGIEFIEYSGDIDSIFYKLNRMLKREQLI